MLKAPLSVQATHPLSPFRQLKTDAHLGITLIIKMFEVLHLRSANRFGKALVCEHAIIMRLAMKAQTGPTATITRVSNRTGTFLFLFV